MDNRSVLLDIIKHTSGLGIIENIKVEGDKKKTSLAAMDPDRTVILNAELKQPVKDFQGEFGMGNLGLLSSLVKLSNYQGDDAKIEIKREERNGQEMPTTIVFTDNDGNRDQYRFMSKEIVEQAMKVAKFRGAKWDITVNPSAASVGQLAEVAGIYSGIEPSFSVKTEDNNLVFEVGSNEGGVIGRRIFAKNIEGKLTSSWSWPLSTFLSIVKLGMNGTCVVKFSNQGACQIDIDSGVGVYSYILPAISR